MMISTIAILGGGQAGAQAVDTLRREGFGGRLVLIGDEPHLPYQRPPLSKQFLAGDMAADRLPFRHQAFYDQQRVELKLASRRRASIRPRSGSSWRTARRCVMTGCSFAQARDPGV